MPLDAATVDELTQRLFGDQTSQASALLRMYGLKPHEREVPRVHAAILKLSNGDLAALARFVTLAQADYRDVLVAAEYPSEGGSRRSALALEGLAERRRADRGQYLAWLRRHGVEV